MNREERSERRRGHCVDTGTSLFDREGGEIHAGRGARKIRAQLGPTFPAPGGLAVDTLSVGPKTLSRLMLPVVPTPKLGPPVACGQQDAVRCVPSP